MNDENRKKSYLSAVRFFVFYLRPLRKRLEKMFATLNGGDICSVVISDWKGLHFDIKTTGRYLHVSKQKLVNIVSPLDELWRRGLVEW